jgi:glutamine synthetase
MPKPLYGTDGSGLHCRQSLVQDGRSVFSDAADPLGLSPQARHYVAGLLAHARALTAITNPVVNSYKRLVPGYEAPAYITWAANHPSPLVRTTVLADDAWIELRSPDPACNPYLAFAGMLAAGLDGMTSEQVPPPPANVDVHALSDEERLSRGIYRLPANLEQALEALEEDFILQEALGDHAISRLVRTRMLEWDAYRRTVHAWEHEQYLDL